MSRVSTWLLIPPVSARLSERYRHYRRHGASVLSAALGCFWMILAWMFIPLEHPRWQRIRARHSELYPHINPDRPRPLDPARYLIQAVWLVATMPRPEHKARAGAVSTGWRIYVNATISGWTDCPTA
jgi:cellulose synthase (UDP-forming)